MIIAIASGNGGTGKTTLSVALALVAQEPVTLLDCDVEEPNDFLFFTSSDIELRFETFTYNHLHREHKPVK